MNNDISLDDLDIDKLLTDMDVIKTPQVSQDKDPLGVSIDELLNMTIIDFSDIGSSSDVGSSPGEQQELPWELPQEDVVESKPEKSAKQHLAKKKRKNYVIMTLIIIPIIIVLLGSGVFISNVIFQIPESLFGYSTHIMDNGTMHSEIEMGTFVLAEHVNPGMLEEGDIVLFTTIGGNREVRKIYEIFEGEEGVYNRTFQTIATEIYSPDPEFLDADRIIGRVVYQSGGLGVFVSLIQARAIFAIAIVVMTIALFVVLFILFKPEKSRP